MVYKTYKCQGKLKESGVINDYELKLIAKDGRVIDVSVSSKIIFNEDGKYPHPTQYR